MSTNDKAELPKNAKNKELLKWVDEQELDEEIIIKDVRTNKKCKLIPLE